MFCIYCGTGNPDDALFCRNCGKRQPQQKAQSRTSSTGAIILPTPPLPETLQRGVQPPVGNVPMVQGTPSTHNVEGQMHSAERHQIESQIYPLHTTPTYINSPLSDAHNSRSQEELVAHDGLKLVDKLPRWNKTLVISSLVTVVVVIFASVAVSKLSIYTTTPQTVQTVIASTSIPNTNLCSSDAAINKDHPLQQDDGQAAQGDQGSFSPVFLCSEIKASRYAISFHATSPYISLYLYDSKHAHYEIDYDIYADHITVVSYPGFSTANAISVGNGTYSNAGWHTYRIEFRNDFVKVIVDGTTVLSGSAGFTDNGSGDDLLLQSHQITMDQFSVTRL